MTKCWGQRRGKEKRFLAGIFIFAFFISSFSFISFASFSATAKAASINSGDVIARTLTALPHCLHYRVKGVCFWTLPTGVYSTPYLEHYLPDVVVMVFNKPGENPWIEMNNTLDVAGEVAERSLITSIAQTKAGGGQHAFNDPLQENTFFKAVDIVGNPVLSVLPKNLLLLPSTATPWFPYYQSMLDSILWRGFPPFAEPEQIYAGAMGLTRYIGSQGGLIRWGSAIPIEGKVQTTRDAKAAAVIAQRASNLITQNALSNFSFGHVYKPLSTNCGQGCLAANIKENKEETRFQMIYPLVESDCQTFGKTLDYGEEAEVKTQGAYAWVLWRKYEGCVQGAGIYSGRART